MTNLASVFYSMILSWGRELVETLSTLYALARIADDPIVYVSPAAGNNYHIWIIRLS